MIYSVSDYLHHVIEDRLKDCLSVIDMGGVGKMNERGYIGVNANIRYGIEATKMPFKDNKFV